MSTLPDLARRFAAAPQESFRSAIDRGNAWLEAVVAAGYEEAIVAEFGECDEAVRVVGEPASQEQIRGIEAELGCALPPSYRRFLCEVGAVAFFNYWWDETTEIDAVARISKVLTDPATDFGWRDDPIWHSLPTAPLVRVCDHHNGEEWFYVTAAHDSAGEAPLVLGFHDEPDLYFADALHNPPATHATFEHWLSDQVDRTITFVTDRVSRHVR
ncbi:SMI1/KNR4 family protein [Nocardia sp. NPDC050710]|uniref:SMI1/KNR4 family protein n=1 Tax=Nocardia sp. NPDC050710 TaxID=3157220 RepID=UPI0034073423